MKSEKTKKKVKHRGYHNGIEIIVSMPDKQNRYHVLINREYIGFSKTYGGAWLLVINEHKRRKN